MFPRENASHSFLISSALLPSRQPSQKDRTASTLAGLKIFRFLHHLSFAVILPFLFTLNEADHIPCAI